MAHRLIPERSSRRVAQSDTVRLWLPRIATRVVEWKSELLVHLLSACPD